MRNIRIAYWEKYDGNKYHCCCRSDNLRLAFQLLAPIVSSRTLALWCWHCDRCWAVIMSATFTPTLNVDIGTNELASARKHRDQLESKSVTLACAGNRGGYIRWASGSMLKPHVLHNLCLQMSRNILKIPTSLIHASKTHMLLFLLPVCHVMGMFSFLLELF